MTDLKRNYKATFTLSQEGEDGEIVSTLVFDPLVTRDEVEAGTLPEAYDIMSHFAHQFLMMAGIVDEDGDLIDSEAFHSQTRFIVRQETGKVN